MIKITKVKTIPEEGNIGFLSGDKKGFIVKTFGKNEYKFMALDRFEKGNGWVTADNTYEALVGFLKYKEVFVFETPKELFKWLSED